MVTPLSWELIEPAEGKFDFTLVDGLIDQARQTHERIVFLWLASWKNGMSSYAPVWVKQDSRRFARVVAHGSEVEILSPLCAATEEADARAFAALMRHIKEVDGTQMNHTVLMMQVENEVGVLGDSRDHSEAANKAFAGAVPGQLTAYLAAHRDELYPELRELWKANGEKSAGTWAEVFGDRRAGRRDLHGVAVRAVYSIRGGARQGGVRHSHVCEHVAAGDNTPPGEYPSGGPQPRVMDVWKAAGTGLDFYSPDLYAPNFEEWCKRYHREGNPLYMPETRGGATGRSQCVLCARRGGGVWIFAVRH